MHNRGVVLVPGYRRRAGMPASHPQGHRVVYVLGHPQTATVPEGKHKKVCTCPSFEDFLTDYEKGRDDDFDVKVTDANRPEHIGGRTFERVKELELHFECEVLPSKNERSFGSMFIMACPNLEYLHIKGHADGSIIRTVAVYNSQRPAKLMKIKFDETVMVHDPPDMDDHNDRDGVGFNAFFYDRGQGRVEQFRNAHFEGLDIDLPKSTRPGSPSMPKKADFGTGGGLKAPPVASAPPPAYNEAEPPGRDVLGSRYDA